MMSMGNEGSVEFVFVESRIKNIMMSKIAGCCIP